MFSIEETALNSEFDKKSVDGWDSVHQFSLISSIEDEFDIMLDAEDVLEFTSYDNTKAILAKYDVKL